MPQRQPSGTARTLRSTSIVRSVAGVLPASRCTQGPPAATHRSGPVTCGLCAARVHHLHHVMTCCPPTPLSPPGDAGHFAHRSASTGHGARSCSKPRPVELHMAPIRRCVAACCRELAVQAAGWPHRCAAPRTGCGGPSLGEAQVGLLRCSLWLMQPTGRGYMVGDGPGPLYGPQTPILAVGCGKRALSVPGPRRPRSTILLGKRSLPGPQHAQWGHGRYCRGL